MTLSKFSRLILTLTLFLLPLNFVYAGSTNPCRDSQGRLDLSCSLKLNATDSVGQYYNSPADLLNTIIPNLFILSGLILLCIFFFGGFFIITAGDNPEQAQKGKQALTGAIIGFVIIFASYWIIQLIEILTGITILNFNLI